MKKLIPLFTCVLLLSTMLVSCQNEKENSIQRIFEFSREGRMQLLIETDKSIYEYDDNIYVTLTLVNKDTQALTLFVPSSAKNAQRVLSVSLENDGNQLIDVDTYAAYFTDDESYFTLNPKESYFQIMRFSTRHYNMHGGANMFTPERPPDGIYYGAVMAVEFNGSKYTEHLFQFQVEIKPRTW